jgi:hypothetical protein
MTILKRLTIIVIMLSFLLLGIQSSFAESLQTSVTAFQPLHITTTDYQKLGVTRQKEIASTWSLEVKDYSHYLWLMQNTSNGLYYADKNLDPSWILGFNARNDEERRKFAEVAIKNERIRVEGELAFQRTFSQLYRELYPDEFPIRYTAFKTLAKAP